MVPTRSYIPREELLARHDASSGEELRASLWRQATTDNGVVAIKYGMHAAWHEALTELIDTDHAPSEAAAWASFFPGCRHVFLTRRDKVRLAVSWWRAIQSQEWHREPGNDSKPDALSFRDRYDPEAIRHLLLEATLREAEIPDAAYEAIADETSEDWVQRFRPTSSGGGTSACGDARR